MNMQTTRNTICSLAVVAAAGLSTNANAQALTNGSFETFAPIGSEFLFDNWLNFGNTQLNELDVVPFDGDLAVKTFGAFFYQFPFGIEGLPEGFPVGDLPASDVPYDTLPTNNTVVFQILGENDEVDDARVGECVRATVRYYQRSDFDQLDAAANLPQLTINFRDEPFPAEPVGGTFTNINVATTTTDEWVEFSAEAIVPAGTDFIEVLLLHFQFGAEFTVVDADNDGIQDQAANGFPAFDNIVWGSGSANWDFATFDVVTDGCDTEPVCLADFNEDGNINILDVVSFVNNWNVQGPGSDFNNDMQINILDVVGFINTWNLGCP